MYLISYWPHMLSSDSVSILACGDTSYVYTILALPNDAFLRMCSHYDTHDYICNFIVSRMCRKLTSQ